MKELKGRVAVVTGAASGIGRALSEQFGREGMSVVLADIDEEQLADAEERVQQTGAATLRVRTDVSQSGDVESLAAAAQARFGAVHVVCNNAGVFPEPGAVWEQSEEDWRWILSVNVGGVINGIRTFLPILLSQDTEGHVINTASMAGHVVLPFLSPYHATKFAIVAISESLHHELSLSGAKVHVSVLCPGVTKTALANSQQRRLSGDGSGSGKRSKRAVNFREGFQRLVAGGADPSVVAEKLVNAIRDERFYVFTHPHEMPAIRARFDGLLAEVNPTLALPDEMRDRLGLS